MQFCFSDVKITGTVYVDGRPEEWEEEMPRKGTEQWNEFEKESCDAVSFVLVFPLGLEFSKLVPKILANIMNSTLTKSPDKIPK